MTDSAITKDETFETVTAASRIVDERESEVSDAWVRRAGKISWAMLLVLPMTFGGVHATIFYSAQAIVFCMLALLVLRFPAALARIMAPEMRSARTVFGCLLAFALYCTAQVGILALLQVPHAVTGSVSRLPEPAAAVSALREIYFFCATFLLFRLFLVPSVHRAHRLMNFTGIVLLCVAMTALAHWFYDNGKLFWIFTPDYVFTSDRARWPFVNSNHLGHFMLPLFFIALGGLFSSLRRVDTRVLERKRDVTELVSSKTFQRGALQLASWSFLVLVSLLTITATLSRGSWFGLSAALLAFVVIDWQPKKRPGADGAGGELAAMEHHDRPRRHRRRHTFSTNRGDERGIDFKRAVAFLARVWRPTLLCVACVAFYFYLQGRGSELVGERIEYGLMHSKDDMRWQLYADTTAMLKEHPFFGVGLGGWAATYNRYMDPLLAGIIPVYLHSDPQQILAETGLIGVLPLAGLFVFTLVNGIRAARAASSATRATIAGLTCGLLGFCLASIFDFPLRIPAIVFWTATLLALTSFYIDRTLYSSSENPGRPD